MKKKSNFGKKSTDQWSIMGRYERWQLEKEKNVVRSLADLGPYFQLVRYFLTNYTSAALSHAR